MKKLNATESFGLVSVKSHRGSSLILYSWERASMSLFNVECQKKHTYINEKSQKICTNNEDFNAFISVTSNVIYHHTNTINNVLVFFSNRQKGGVVDSSEPVTLTWENINLRTNPPSTKCCKRNEVEGKHILRNSKSRIAQVILLHTTISRLNEHLSRGINYLLHRALRFWSVYTHVMHTVANLTEIQWYSQCYGNKLCSEQHQTVCTLLVR